MIIKRFLRLFILLIVLFNTGCGYKYFLNNSESKLPLIK